uniref:Uncharacterized protein n=1 Tax=Chromera velia CCMP2878 TaxID=1169474 RepID=A0A0G4HQD0_9ALVE|eukprot:Cvel_7925.t1-p1 / transcript=Cvel_7925.t1 / gene=Cvel_7925 / organism=Chromera_velia_CCMP2878 / gene_product=hypothetical protein / transcript_product=hypothetical protein / location=Cvel_scaffold425:10504-25767(+) / protein_length=2149 / sequence_SO=supercontig / SO=protein_coding / is_pseudo=false
MWKWFAALKTHFAGPPGDLLTVSNLRRLTGRMEDAETHAHGWPFVSPRETDDVIDRGVTGRLWESVVTGLSGIAAANADRNPLIPPHSLLSQYASDFDSSPNSKNFSEHREKEEMPKPRQQNGEGGHGKVTKVPPQLLETIAKLLSPEDINSIQRINAQVHNAIHTNTGFPSSAHAEHDQTHEAENILPAPLSTLPCLASLSPIELPRRTSPPRPINHNHNSPSAKASSLLSTQGDGVADSRGAQAFRVPKNCTEAETRHFERMSRKISAVEEKPTKEGIEKQEIHQTGSSAGARGSHRHRGETGAEVPFRVVPRTGEREASRALYLWLSERLASPPLDTFQPPFCQSFYPAGDGGREERESEGGHESKGTAVDGDTNRDTQRGEEKIQDGDGEYQDSLPAPTRDSSLEKDSEAGGVLKEGVPVHTSREILSHQQEPGGQQEAETGEAEEPSVPAPSPSEAASAHTKMERGFPRALSALEREVRGDGETGDGSTQYERLRRIHMNSIVQVLEAVAARDGTRCKETGALLKGVGEVLVHLEWVSALERRQRTERMEAAVEGIREMAEVSLDVLRASKDLQRVKDGLLRGRIEMSSYCSRLEWKLRDSVNIAAAERARRGELETRVTELERELADTKEALENKKSSKSKGTDPMFPLCAFGFLSPEQWQSRAREQGFALESVADTLQGEMDRRNRGGEEGAVQSREVPRGFSALATIPREALQVVPGVENEHDAYLHAQEGWRGLDDVDGDAAAVVEAEQEETGDSAQGEESQKRPLQSEQDPAKVQQKEEDEMTKTPAEAGGDLSSPLVNGAMKEKTQTGEKGEATEERGGSTRERERKTSARKVRMSPQGNQSLGPLTDLDVQPPPAAGGGTGTYAHGSHPYVRGDSSLASGNSLSHTARSVSVAAASPRFTAQRPQSQEQHQQQQQQEAQMQGQGIGWEAGGSALLPAASASHDAASLLALPPQGGDRHSLSVLGQRAASGQTLASIVQRENSKLKQLLRTILELLIPLARSPAAAWVLHARPSLRKRVETADKLVTLSLQAAYEMGGGGDVGRRREKAEKKWQELLKERDAEIDQLRSKIRLLEEFNEFREQRLREEREAALGLGKEKTGGESAITAGGENDQEKGGDEQSDLQKDSQKDSPGRAGSKSNMQRKGGSPARSSSRLKSRQGTRQKGLNASEASLRSYNGGGEGGTQPELMIQGDHTDLDSFLTLVRSFQRWSLLSPSLLRVLGLSTIPILPSDKQTKMLVTHADKTDKEAATLAETKVSSRPAVPLNSFAPLLDEQEDEENGDKQAVDFGASFKGVPIGKGSETTRDRRACRRAEKEKEALGESTASKNATQLKKGKSLALSSTSRGQSVAAEGTRDPELRRAFAVALASRMTRSDLCRLLADLYDWRFEEEQKQKQRKWGGTREREGREKEKVVRWTDGAASRGAPPSSIRKRALAMSVREYFLQRYGIRMVSRRGLSELSFFLWTRRRLQLLGQARLLLRQASGRFLGDGGGDVPDVSSLSWICLQTFRDFVEEAFPPGTPASSACLRAGEGASRRLHERLGGEVDAYFQSDSRTRMEKETEWGIRQEREQFAFEVLSVCQHLKRLSRRGEDPPEVYSSESSGEGFPLSLWEALEAALEGWRLIEIGGEDAVKSESNSSGRNHAEVISLIPLVDAFIQADRGASGVLTPSQQAQGLRSLPGLSRAWESSGPLGFGLRGRLTEEIPGGMPARCTLSQYLALYGGLFVSVVVSLAQQGHAQLSMAASRPPRLLGKFDGGSLSSSERERERGGGSNGAMVEWALRVGEQVHQEFRQMERTLAALLSSLVHSEEPRDREFCVQLRGRLRKHRLMLRRLRSPVSIEGIEEQTGLLGVSAGMDSQSPRSPSLPSGRGRGDDKLGAGVEILHNFRALLVLLIGFQSYIEAEVPQITQLRTPSAVQEECLVLRRVVESMWRGALSLSAYSNVQKQLSFGGGDDFGGPLPSLGTSTLSAVPLLRALENAAAAAAPSSAGGWGEAAGSSGGGGNRRVSIAGIPRLPGLNQSAASASGYRRTSAAIQLEESSPVLRARQQALQLSASSARPQVRDGPLSLPEGSHQSRSEPDGAGGVFGLQESEAAAVAAGSPALASSRAVLGEAAMRAARLREEIEGTGPAWGSSD